MTVAARPWPLRPGPVTFGMMFATGAFGRALIMTIIPLEALTLLGNARDVSIMFSAVAAANLLASFALPWLIARFRRRPVYMAACVLAAIAPLLLAVGDIVALPAGALAREFAGTSLYVVQNLYLMDHIRKRDFVRSEPIRLMFQAAAWGFGPAAGVWLFLHVDPWAAWGVAIASSLAEIVYFRAMGIADMAIVAPRAAKPRNPLRFFGRFFSQPRLRLAYVIAFSRSTWWVVLNIYGPVYMVRSGAGEDWAGIVVSAGNLMLFSTLALGWLARRVGVRRVIMGSFTMCGIATLGIAWAWPDPWAGFALFVVGAAAAVALDAVGAIPFLRAVRTRERAEMTMVYMTFIHSSQLGPTAVFAVLLALFDLPVVFVATACLLFWAAWIARWVPRSM